MVRASVLQIAPGIVQHCSPKRHYFLKGLRQHKYSRNLKKRVFIIMRGGRDSYYGRAGMQLQATEFYSNMHDWQQCPLSLAVPGVLTSVNCEQFQETILKLPGWFLQLLHDSNNLFFAFSYYKIFSVLNLSLKLPQVQCYNRTGFCQFFMSHIPFLTRWQNFIQTTSQVYHVLYIQNDDADLLQQGACFGLLY